MDVREHVTFAERFTFIQLWQQLTGEFPPVTASSIL